MDAELTYRIAGGAPAGISILPGELGWRTKSTKIRTTTMQGNKMTTPRGTEMLELPFNRMGFRKKANRDASDFDGRCLCAVFSSAVGSRGGPLGINLPARRKRSILAGWLPSRRRCARGGLRKNKVFLVSRQSTKLSQIVYLGCRIMELIFLFSFFDPVNANSRRSGQILSSRCWGCCARTAGIQQR